MNIVYFGTSNFAVSTIKLLLGDPEILKKFYLEKINNISVPLIITKPDMPNKRGKALVPSPVKNALLNELGYTGKILSPRTIDENLFNEISKVKPDMIITAAYGKILPKSILDLPQVALNIHGSLLPKYRGASPIQTAILNADKQTGVTIIRMDEGIDTGKILLTKVISMLNGNEHGCDKYKTYTQIEEELSNAGAKLIYEIINKINNREEIKSTEQDNSLASLTKTIDKSEGELDFVNNTALENYLKVNALSNNPGVFFYHKNQRIKVTEAFYGRKQLNGEFGKIIKLNKKAGEIIVNSKGTPFIIKRLVIPGKNEMSVADCLRGNSIFD